MNCISQVIEVACCQWQQQTFNFLIGEGFLLHLLCSEKISATGLNTFTLQAIEETTPVAPDEALTNHDYIGWTGFNK